MNPRNGLKCVFVCLCVAGFGCRVIILGKSGFIVCACEVVRECLCACVCVVCVWCV